MHFNARTTQPCSCCERDSQAKIDRGALVVVVEVTGPQLSTLILFWPRSWIRARLQKTENFPFFGGVLTFSSLRISLDVAKAKSPFFSHKAVSDHEKFIEALWRQKNDSKSRQDWYRWAQQQWKRAKEAERREVLESSIDEPGLGRTTGEPSGCLPEFFMSRGSGQATSSRSAARPESSPLPPVWEVRRVPHQVQVILIRAKRLSSASNGRISSRSSE